MQDLQRGLKVDNQPDRSESHESRRGSQTCSRIFILVYHFNSLHYWDIVSSGMDYRFDLPDCSMVFQPFYGQTANIFGRWLMISAIVLFIVGSAIGGAAQDMSMLIVGRAIQVSH
jgi:hypothetical protein